MPQQQCWGFVLSYQGVRSQLYTLEYPYYTKTVKV